MVQITIQVGGMMCGMCESHLNNAIRTAFSVKKVTASHSRGRIVIVAEETIDEAALRKVVSDTGYTVGQITSALREKAVVSQGLNRCCLVYGVDITRYEKPTHMFIKI